MQLKSLKTFCDVVRLGSFSKAAELNGVSQSNVSQLVHQLEERLGVRLIDRSKRPFVLTPEGERYYDGCRDLVRHYDELERQVRALGDGVGTVLTVAAIYSVGLACMHRVVSAYRDANPRVDLRVDYMHPAQVTESVEAGDADLGVVSYPEESRALRVRPWRDETFAVAAAPRSAWAGAAVTAGDAPAVEVADLDGEAFVLPQHGLRMRDEIDRFFASRRVRVRVAAEFDNLESVKRAVEVEEGLALLPAPTFAAEVTGGTLARVDLLGEPLIRPLGVIQRRDQETTDAAQSFLDLLQRNRSVTASAPAALAASGASKPIATA